MIAEIRAWVEGLIAAAGFAARHGYAGAEAWHLVGSWDVEGSQWIALRLAVEAGW